MRNKTWMKKTMAMVITGAMVAAFSGCGSKIEGVDIADTTVVAEVANVDGDVVTVTLGAISSTGMEMPQGNDADGAPEKSSDNSGENSDISEKLDGSSGENGDMPEKPDGGSGENDDVPEKPDGDSGENGDIPDKPDGMSKENNDVPEKPDEANLQKMKSEESSSTEEQGEESTETFSNDIQPSDRNETQKMDETASQGMGNGGMDGSGEQFVESETVATVYMSSKTTIKAEDGSEEDTSLEVGDVVRLTIDEDGKVTEITVLDVSVSSGGNTGDSASDMGGQSQGSNLSYTAVNEYSEDTTIEGDTISSTGTDENAVLVTDGTVSLSSTTITRTSSDSTGGDDSSFYGVGAAVLGTGGTTYVSNANIETDSAGGAGIFAYGDSKVYVSDTTINTSQDTSGGIHAAGGGSLYAWNVTATTQGESSAAIRSDRGGGTMVVNGGSYTSNGTGSPAVYCTADIVVNQSTLTANGSEAVCIEGLNSLRLYDCDLTGNMGDNEQNDCKWNVILYQSMSGDSEVGNSTFEMVGGTLTAKEGGMFYTTNTESTFYLENVDITYSEENDFFLKCTGNSNARGWGSAGSNGADCSFTANKQDMEGDILWDSISELDFYMINGSTLTGAIVQDESNAGNGGDGTCKVSISEDSTWVVTADSTVTTLSNAGNIVDENGKTVTIVDTDGNTIVKGNSNVTITVNEYSETANDSNAGSGGSFSNYEVEKPDALSK